jgi:hypothetical protein
MTDGLSISTLATALSLPIHNPPGSLGNHIIFKGPMMSFHYRLDECRVAHEVTVDPVEGMGIAIEGLVVERGDLGGVLVREDPQWNPDGRAILFGISVADDERKLWAAREVYRWAEESRSDYKGDEA